MGKQAEENDNKMGKSDDEVATDIEEDARRDYIKIDVDPLADELENMIADTVSMLPKYSPCIFRVPNILSRHNPKAYKPNAFSLGPFHYNQLHLKPTRSENQTETKLNELTTTIRELQEEARECYEGSIKMSMDEFIKVMVIDGCFIIELFCKDNNDELIGENDPIFGVNCMMSMLTHDLILLENQIPWLVLESLFKKIITPDHVNLPLITLVTNFFNSLFCRGVEICQEVHKYENLHILDLLRNSLVLPSSIAKQETNNTLSNDEWQVLPSATILVEAGIKFKKAEISNNILDIKFKNGVMEIPSLFIQDVTESLFRNLICFEQCLPFCEEVINSYLTFLDYLINSRKDVEIFSKEKIIENWIDNEETAVFLNRIVNDTSVDRFYYFDLVNEVNKYCQRRWPRYRRVLIHDYFRHPWAFISVSAAIILLILTIVQTVFTIIK
ncbi:hypothetical protein CsatA_017289 [Cannabis sativa]